MIIRYGGGNDGIAEYLENGRKAEREYTRDELDHRLILDGDLQTTNKIIQSIEDKGQERYLHITLSFQESEVSVETLSAVTQEYKTLFMSAYHEDEYCFYAEAHLPKIKNLVDNRTGEHVERKPHIHIVIPRTNLVTEKAMNPIGDLTKSKTQEQLDAIQEHINNKYHLVSPKDAMRVSDQNYANVLSRTKGDLFNERNSDVKRGIYTRLESENIRSFSDFKNLLSEYGEVKTRNAGKAGEYLSVKLDGDKKFTNLKNPLFSRQYIESRELPLIKPTEKQILSRLEEWTNRASHEIKHIYPASSRVREAYKSLDDKGKAHFLAERIKSYDEKNKLNKEYAEQARGRKSGNERGFEPSSRFDRLKAGIGLPRLPQRGLVYGVNGRAAPESIRVLSDNVERDLAKRIQERQYSNREVRRDSDRQQQGRGLKTVEESFFVNDLLLNKLNEEAEKNELATMGKIRKEIDPERFLSAVAREFNVSAASHAVSKAPDGSPRFSVGKRNLNASDFLTKHLNLSWSDAKKFLLKTYSDQETKKPFDKPVINRALNRKEAKERLVSLKSGNKTLRDFVKDERRKMYNDLREMRKELRSIPPSDREVAKGVLVYKKLTTLESLAEMEKEGRNIISQYHENWLEGSEKMIAIDRLKSYLNREEENGIQADQPETSLVKAVEAQKRLEELHRSNTKLKDLVMDKQDGKIIYRDQETESPVFTDKGDFVVAGKESTKDEIAIMLDYSREKFGGVLKLTGTDEFKQQCATIAAERGMNIILRPEKFQKLMLETKAELDANKIHQNEKEIEIKEPQPESNENAVTRETEQEVTLVPEALEQEIYIVHRDDMGVGMCFHSKEEAFEYFENQTNLEIKRVESQDDFKTTLVSSKSISDFENILISSKTISTNEIDAYKDGSLVEVDQSCVVIADSQSKLDELLYVVTFQKESLNEHIKPFDSVAEAVEYRDKVSQLHGLDQKDAKISSVSRGLLTVTSIHDAAKEADPVPRHEIERAQGRDVSEQDGKILEAIDQYQDKFVSEGLEFNRPEMEAELLNHDLTRDVAEDRLEQKFTEEKSRYSEQERDNNIER
ncbi:relaxase/mobilization nuclease domain-containing protein (plasmid) [Edwardsiella tarda]|uniref:LPD7 domain-containing protein n=1 Tax=Edwardsiella tarda TaxID=636 RepID=UPI000D524FCA|nr:LPD7 domain-containing protein [Edwardsiella tarda]UCQ29631.1 relaxase/mobilization nuclease domain-containing protein [Edwardsiella tarda]